MSTKRRSPHPRPLGKAVLVHSIAALLALCLAPPKARGQTWLLNPVSGNWNTVANWNPATVPNSAGATATFDLSNKTAVSLSANTTVGSIIFDTTGYTISGASTLTLAGATPTIEVTNAGDSDTISAKLAGTAGLTASGAGTLVLANTANSYTGGTTISTGVVQIGTSSAAGSVGSGGVSVNNGGVLMLVNASGTAFAGNVTNGVGNLGTLNIDSIKTNTISGLLTDGAAGQLALTQSGTGTTILTNAGDQYSGATQISAGTLEIGTATVAGALGSGSSVNVGTGGTLLLSKVFVASLNNNVTNGLGATGLVNVALATDIALNGTLSDGVGKIALTQSGAGTTTLAGNDSYTGATTVTAGTLQIGNGTTGNLTGATTVTVSGTGSLAVDLSGGSSFARNVNLSATGTALKAVQANSNTISGVISGTGAFDQNGAGTTILSNSETYTGATNVHSGTLELDGSLAPASTVNVSNGGMLTGAGNIPGKATLTTNGTIALISTGTIAGTLAVTGGNWAADGRVNGLVTSSSGTFNINGTLLAPAGLTVTGGTLAGTGVIEANLNYTSSANSTFEGSIAAATVTMNKSGSTLAIGGLVTAAPSVQAGTLQIGDGTSGSLAAADNVTVSGSGIFATDLAAGSTFSNNVTLNGSGAMLKAVQAGSNTLSGVISGTGIFVQSGGGATILNKTETYTGATNVINGTLELDGRLATTSTVNVGTVGTLTGAGTIPGKATLTGNGVINFGAQGNIDGTLGVTGGNWNGQGTVSGAVTSSSSIFSIGSGAILNAPAGLNVTGGILAGSGTVNGNVTYTSSSSSTFAGGIAGNTLTMNKAGSTLVLTGANTYGGATTVSAGTLQIGDGTSGSLSGAVSVTVTGSGALAIDLADSGVFTHNITLNGTGATLQAVQSGTNTFSGSITGTGGYDQNGFGNTIFSSTQTYTGVTNVNGGELEVEGSLLSPTVNVNSGGLSSTGTIFGKVTMAGGVLVAGTLSSSLSATGGGINGQVTVNGLTTVSTASNRAFDIQGTLTALAGVNVTGGAVFVFPGSTLAGSLNYTSSSPSFIDGVIADGPFTVSKVTMNRAGSTLRLDGANTYTGATTVSAGTLLVNGSLANTAVTVNSGGTLSGTGTISGSTTINSGGVLVPAGSNAPGTFDLGPLSLKSGSKVNYDLGIAGATNANDLTAVTGNLTLGGTLNINGLFGFGAGTYELFTYTAGALTGTTMTIGTVPAGFKTSQFAIQTSTPGQVDLVVTGGPLVQYWNGPFTAGNGMTGGGTNGVQGGSGNWDNVTTNWTDPSGATSTKWAQAVAIFSAGSGTVTVDDSITAPSVGFLKGAGAYTLSVTPNNTLTLSGSGVTNTSNTTQTIQTSVDPTTHIIGVLAFTNNASAGSMVAIKNNGGITQFENSSSAGSAAITNSASAVAGSNAGGTDFHATSTLGTGSIINASATFSGGFAGTTTFQDFSSAGTFTSIQNEASAVAGAPAGSTTFSGHSTAGSAAIQSLGASVNGASGGFAEFEGSASAGSAFLQAHGGQNGGGAGGFYFSGTADGGTAQVEFMGGGGFLDISGLTSTGMKIGTILNTGNVYLGGKSLTVADPFTPVIATFSGVLSDGGVDGGTGGSFVKAGGDELILNGTNTYTGGTTASSGTLQIGDGTSGSLASVSAVTVASKATLALDLPGGASFLNRVANSGHVVLGGTANNYFVTSPISGSGDLTQAGSNLAVLAAANTYSGGTTVNAGTLIVSNSSGSGTGTGPVTINSGGTFGGSGKITGAMILNSGGTIAPGAGSTSAGTTLNGSSLLWNSGGTLTFKVGATASDLLALTGALSIGSDGVYTLDLINVDLNAGDVYNYTLATFASTTFLQSTNSQQFQLELPTNYTGTLVVTSTSLEIEDLHDPPPAAPHAEGLETDLGSMTGTSDPVLLNAAPTPEPGSLALLSLGAAAVLGWRRRRRCR